MDNALLKLTDAAFPLTVIEHAKTEIGPLFEAHLHEQHLQIFYFTFGKVKMFYNQTASEFGPHDMLLINTHELHYGESLSEEVRYFVFRIDLRLLVSYGIPSFGPKYLEPMKNGLVLFQNELHNEEIKKLLEGMIEECRSRREGYELTLLALVLDLLGRLFRNHKGKVYTQQSAEVLMKKTKRFAAVFDYIEKNYDHAVSLSEVAEHAHLSDGYFCRAFKQATGKTLVDYLNRFRIEKAVILLNQGTCNVTAAALSVGFDDINYFSRVFKKYMKQSPESYLHNDRRFFL